jgi:membrane fusion protein, multidrug efflux system
MNDEAKPQRPQASEPAEHAEKPSSDQDQSRPSFFKRPWVIISMAILLGVGTYYGLHFYFRSLAHQSTDDAFLEADVVSMAPKVAGQVIKLHVTDNRLVNRGDLLLEIDPRDYEARVKEKSAALKSAETGLGTAKSRLQAARSALDAAEAGRAQLEAQANAAKAEAVKAESDLERNRELLARKTISPQEFDAFRATAKTTAANYEAARQRVATGESQVNQARADVTAAQIAIDTAEAEVKVAQAGLQTAELNLSYTRVQAPVTGHVTRRAVDVGSYLQVGQTVMALVPTNIYVVANYKENQLHYMRSGQSVEIDVSAYPGEIYHGHVDSIQRGSGARFSLLPPENAVGNFVKVVQRVPVKIFFDEPLSPYHVFGPGMSVEPSVKVRDIYVSPIVIVLIAIAIAILFAFLGLRWAGKSRRTKAEETHPGEVQHAPANA